MGEKRKCENVHYYGTSVESLFLSQVAMVYIMALKHFGEFSTQHFFFFFGKKKERKKTLSADIVVAVIHVEVD